jgi:polysaccharide biosynthesis transport protein
VVDADLRGRALAPRLGAAPSTGLAGVLAGAPLEEALRVVADGTAELRVLPAGAAVQYPDDLLGSEQMASVLRALTGEFDVVIIDTPPLLAVSDALAILHLVSGVLCVARMDQTPRPAMSRMREFATAAGGRILGTVATGVRSPRRKRRMRQAPSGRPAAAMHRPRGSPSSR